VRSDECANIVRDVAELTILGNHDAAVAGRMDTRITTRLRVRRSISHAKR